MRTMVPWALVLAACSSDPGGACPPVNLEGRRLPERADLALERVYAVARGPMLAEVGGLSGALSPGAGLKVGGRALTADAHGRFQVQLEAAVGDAVSIQTDARPDLETALTVRDATVARAAMVSPRWGGAGSAPNDLAFAGDRLLLVRSGDAALSALPLGHGADDCGQGLRFSSNGAVAADPWFVAVDGGRAFVSDFRLDRVVEVELDSMSTTISFQDPRPLLLDQAWTLACPSDIDGDGAQETEVQAFTPRAPQALAVLGGRLFVGMTGFHRARNGDCPPVFLPSVLLSYAADQPEEPPLRLRLPLQNPQEIRVGAGGVLIVVCSGELDQGSGAPRPETDGGLVYVDPVRLEVLRTVPLGRFAPGSVLEAEGRSFVSSLVKAEVVALSASGSEDARFHLNSEAVDSIFRLVEGPGGLILAPSFDSDRLHVIDPVLLVQDGAPFFGPIPLGPGRPLFSGLQILARRPGRPGLDFVGPDYVALLGIASELVAIDTLKVLGP
ncbi:MAG: hypothetical protein U1E65_35375 [Myxococcota bacterium]